ncbi:MAG: DNA mismatch repair protein MutL, partial [Oscillospiraceae bacterium]|nr:DNA mismatch repair protein MutL [Oscillospiraceae bacterium]
VREEAPAAEPVRPAEAAPEPAPEQTSFAIGPAPWRFAGEVLRTYIIAEDGDNVWLIDKHAAHERINFDRMKAGAEPVMRQQLLAPLAVDLPGEQYAVLLENLPLLEEFGFEAEDFGTGCLMVRGIPSDLDTGLVRETLEELSEKLLTAGGADPAAARDVMLHTMACKASIKGGWTSDPAELKVLIEKVQSGEVQYCPHGRPVKVKLSKYEIEKMFKRA